MLVLLTGSERAPVACPETMAKKKRKSPGRSAKGSATKRGGHRSGYCPICGKLLPIGMSAKEIAKLYRQGMSTRQISTIAGINQATVHERLKHQGVKMRPVGAPKRKK